MNCILDFEQPLYELEKRITELRDTGKSSGVDFSEEIEKLAAKLQQLQQETYENLNTWDKVKIARHPNRPKAREYIDHIFTDFLEIHGDRSFADDAAIICGLARLKSHRVCLISIEKGQKTKEKIKHNFGMPRPEGYRKALRAMKLAHKFNLPILTLIDTPGAYPGIGAEERGQSQAISEIIAQSFNIKTPIISAIIGEGGSGGALALGVANYLMMMEFSVYSVISPESCSSILFSDPKKAQWAAQQLKCDATKAKELEIIDEIISEPLGGAHRDKEAAIAQLKEGFIQALNRLSSSENPIHQRYEKYRHIATNAFFEKNITS